MGETNCVLNLLFFLQRLFFDVEKSITGNLKARCWHDVTILENWALNHKRLTCFLGFSINVVSVVSDLLSLQPSKPTGIWYLRPSLRLRTQSPKPQPTPQVCSTCDYKQLSCFYHFLTLTSLFPSTVPQRQTVPVAPRTRLASSEEMTAAIQLVQDHLHSLAPRVPSYNSTELPPSRAPGMWRVFLL